MESPNRYREEEKEELEQEETTDTEEVLEENQKSEEDEVKKLQDEVNRLNDLLLRNRADLENFKRRTNEERIKERKYALQDILTELVDIIDIFDSACNTTTDDPKLKNFLVGFKMVLDRYKNVLDHYGVKKIEALNQKFDPSIHQAMEQVENDEVEEGTIVKVIMNGYKYKDRVLKPSMVYVSKKSKKNTKGDN